MARARLEQLKSNLHYNENTNTLVVSGSQYDALVVSGSADVVPNPLITGSLTIQGVDTFGDSGSFDSIDLGTY